MLKMGEKQRAEWVLIKVFCKPQMIARKLIST